MNGPFGNVLFCLLSDHQSGTRCETCLWGAWSLRSMNFEIRQAHIKLALTRLKIYNKQQLKQTNLDFSFYHCFEVCIANFFWVIVLVLFIKIESGSKNRSHFSFIYIAEILVTFFALKILKLRFSTEIFQWALRFV